MAGGSNLPLTMENHQEINALLEVLANRTKIDHWLWAGRRLLSIARTMTDPDQKAEFHQVLEGWVDWSSSDDRYVLLKAEIDPVLGFS